MKYAYLRSILTGEIIRVHPSTDSPDSSYGFECWVDDGGQSFGQCQFGAPLGFEFVLPAAVENSEAKP